MNGGRRKVAAAVISCSVLAAHAQLNDPAAPPAETMPGAAFPGAPVPAAPPSAAPEADPAATTSQLPPPAAMPGAMAQALGATAAASNIARQDFTRALWVDAQGPALRSPEAVKKLVADARTAGFDTIYAQVRANGDALYQTDLVPKAPGVQQGFDPLRALLEEAKSGDKPLKVHALLVTFRVWTTASGEPPANHVAAQHPEWVILAEDGSREMAPGELWLDPAQTAVQDHLALVATDLVKNYAVDGVQLDRIRYPELDTKRYPDGRLRVGYNQASIDRFNQEKGRTGRPDARDPEWAAWRREQVTETVRKIRDAVKAVRPDIVLSAGGVTFGKPPSNMQEWRNSDPYSTVFSDWVGWAEQGLIDVNALMNFKAADARAAEFNAWQAFAAANKGKARLVSGVGGWLNTPRQVNALLLSGLFQPGADGVALYGYNDTYVGRENDSNLALVQPAIDASLVAARSAEIVSALNQPAQDAASAAARLDQVAQAVGLPADQAPAAPAASVSGLPPVSPAVTGTAAPTAATGLPQLDAAATGAANQAAAPAAIPPPAADEVSLPSLSSAAVAQAAPSSAAPVAQGAPVVSAAPDSSATGLPTLPAVAGSTAGQLPELVVTPALPPSAAAPVPPLPALSDLQGNTGANVGVPATLSQPDAVAVPAITPAAQPVLPGVAATELVSPAEIAPGVPAPSLPSLPGTIPGVPISGDASVVIEPPIGTPITSIAPIPPGPPTTTLSVPDTQVRTTVQLPLAGGSSNFDGKPISSSAPAPAVITPPTVLTPAPGTGTNAAAPVNLGEDPVMDRPEFPRADYSEPYSAYGTPNPPYEIRNFTAASIRREKKDVVVLPGPTAQLDIIVLKSGKEFAGRVLQRGSIWRIELPNGSIMTLPGDRVAAVRSTTAPAAAVGTPIPL